MMQQQAYPSDQLLMTKLRVPSLASTVIERPRLSALLDRGLRYRLTLLSAPPGFGKTTLVAHWLQRIGAEHRQDAPATAWVSLTKDDNQLAAFWSYVLAALDQAVPDDGHPFARLRQSMTPQPSDRALIQLINTLSELATPLVLAIDNYQYITSAEVNESLTFVIEHLPEQVHIILLTSHDPDLPLPRWRARGSVVEIHLEQLSCTVDEASAFFASVDLSVPADDLGQVIAQTEGWFAGLRLISVALQHGGDAQLSSAVSGTHPYVRDYLVADVLADQPAEVRTFLICTSILDELCPELCDAVLDVREDAADPGTSSHMLRRLEQLNLFVVALDRRQCWYRYHALFREALHSLLIQNEPHLLATLYQRASAWYEAHHETEVAISYALRGHDWQRAATLIERRLRDMRQHKEYTAGPQISGWIAQLPDEVRRARPMLTLSRSDQQVSPLHSRAIVEPLSAREQEVLLLIAQGASNIEIADTLTLALNTVKRHTSNILAKLNATNRTQAAARARALGLLNAEPQAAPASTTRTGESCLSPGQQHANPTMSRSRAE